MEYEMIESFFDDLSDYMHFFLVLKEARRATSNFSCVATLRKEDDKYLYTLEWKDGRWVGEYVRPFRANEEYLRLFHSGCAEMARRLGIYLETGDINQIPKNPPAFGILSCESPDDLAPPPAEIARSGSTGKYFPVIEEARLVRHYEAGTFTLVLLTDVKCSGIIRCSHLLVALRNGESEPSYVIAAEVDNMQSWEGGSGSHFLCCYPGSGHENLGCSNDWGDLSRFENEACRIMSRELDIPIN
ncbi:MAG: hypothetical protein H8D55_01140 [Deltaproteobacteria bacterium]|nr:hypothetical protein [Deltaproteobacteria bacterium]